MDIKKLIEAFRKNATHGQEPEVVWGVIFRGRSFGASVRFERSGG